MTLETSPLMFASLAAGISCGVFGFTIALTGTVIFCLAAVILRFSPYSNSNELIGNLKLRVPRSDDQRDLIEKRLKTHCKNFELDQLRFLNPKAVETLQEDGITFVEEITRENLQELTYLIRLKQNGSISALNADLAQLEELEGLKLIFEKQPTKL